MNTTVHPIDIYKEMRVLRKNDEELRKFDVFMKAYGNIPKGNNKYTERYVIMEKGTRLVPANHTHFITIIGTLLSDDEKEGPDCFDRTLLDDDTVVDINYVPPQVEVIKVEVNNGSGLSQEEHDKLLEIDDKLNKNIFL